MTWPPGDPNQPYGPPGPPPYGAPYGAPHGSPPPPPPLPYQQYGQPGHPQPPKKSNKTLIIVVSVVVALLVLGGIGVVVVGTYLKDRVVATDVTVGECIADVPDSARVVTLPKVDCSQEHGGEVYAVLTMPDGDYPGTSVIDEWQNKCPAALGDYSAQAMQDDSIGVYVLYPTQETWDAGDRVVTCIATLEPKRTGSIKQ